MGASKTIPRIFSPPPSSHLAPRRPISFFLHRPLHFETYTAILSNQALQVQSARETGSRLRAWNCGSPQPGKPFQKRRQHGNKERNRLRLAKNNANPFASRNFILLHFHLCLVDYAYAKGSPESFK
jgi:hypothetical protein